MIEALLCVRSFHNRPMRKVGGEDSYKAAVSNPGFGPGPGSRANNNN